MVQTSSGKVSENAKNRMKTPSTLRWRIFENAGLFLRLGRPSTLIRYEYGAFQDAIKPEGFENVGFAFLKWTENTLKIVIAENGGTTIIM